jgi:hypothetical protein
MYKEVTTMAKTNDKPKTAKQIYHERKSAGMCVDCGGRRAKKGRVQCQPCITATAERAAARAKKAGKAA